MKQAAKQWLGAAGSWWQLGAEATLVVPLRLARIASGGEAAKAEAELMVSEKCKAHGALLRDLGSGLLGSSLPQIAGGVAKHYLGLVRANRKRLFQDMFGMK